MAVLKPWAEGYAARVNSSYLRVAPDKENQLRFYTKNSLATRQDDKSTTEAVLDIGDVFARTDYSGGEGYDWDPPEFRQKTSPRSEATSFWDSLNIDVSRPDPGDPYLLRLSHQGATWAGSLTSPVDMGTSTNFIYVTDGATIKRFDDWDTTTPSATYTDPTSTIDAIAVAPNNAVMAVDSTGDVWYKTASGSTFTKIYDSPTDGAAAEGIWYAKERWIVYLSDGVSGELAEMPVTGGAIASHVFDTMDASVWSVVSSGPAIVAAVGNGTVRTYTPDNADATAGQTLVPKGRIDMPFGETPYLLGSNAGVLGILTYVRDASASTHTVRFYQAQVLDARYDYIVGQLQLRREWQECLITPSRLAAMPSSRDELMWTIWEQQSGGGRKAMLWRFDIVSGGLSRYTDLGSLDIDLMIGDFDGRFAGIDSAGDVIIKDDLYQSVGWLITPNVTLGLNTDIAWLAHVFAAEFSFGSGAIAELYYSTSPEAILDNADPSWIRIRRIHSTQTGSTSGEQVLENTQSRTIALQIRLYPDVSLTSTPTISRTAIRGMPTHRDWIVEVPVNVSDYIEVPYRQPIRVPGRGSTEHTLLVGLVGQAVDLEVFRPPLQFTGVVDNVAEPIEYITERGSPSKMALIQFRGSLTSSTSLTVPAPTGNEGLGIGLLGVATLGIGESNVT